MIRLNEAGLRVFFNGPQMQNILRRPAEAVLQQAQANASVYGEDTLAIDSGDLYNGLKVQFRPGADSLEATVGTDATDEITGFNYPGWWDEFGGKPWLTGALFQFFPDARLTP